VDQDEVAFVPEFGEQRRMCWRASIVALQAGESFGGKGCDPVSIRPGRGAPRFPIEAEKLVKQAGAFKSQRNGREFGQRDHLVKSVQPPSSYQTACGGPAPFV